MHINLEKNCYSNIYRLTPTLKVTTIWKWTCYIHNLKIQGEFNIVIVGKYGIMVHGDGNLDLEAV